MAQLAEPAVSFLLQSLSNFIIQEANHIGNVRNDAQLLESELMTMRALLKDAEPKQDQLALVKKWISESRELAYEADEVLERFAFQIGSLRRGGIANELKRYACFLNELYKRHKFGIEIQSLRTRVSDINKSFQDEGLIAIMLEKGGSSSSQQQQQLIRRTYSRLGEEEEEDFVGMESDVHILVQKLVNENEKVVSIYGMGGLGKTTIAKHVYNSAHVIRCFDDRVWVCISQQWQAEDILQGILIKLMPEKRDTIQKYRLEELVRELHEVQQRRKCLFVLDDMWKIDAWEAIKSAFSLKSKGSKILVTSRNKDVVEQIDPNGFHHSLKFLSEDESWELLEKKALRKRHEADNQEMEKIEELGKTMAKHCGGLPLAVVVLGGILATRSTLSEWELECRNILSGLGKGKSNKFETVVQQILGLSYNDLSYQLKLCLLYLSSFPEDSEIDAEEICQLWLAEGFVTNMDVAESVLSELVVRCMVLIKLPNFSRAKRRRFESCRLHDLMRDLYLHKAKEENFMSVIKGSSDYFKDGNESLFEKVHRLVIDFDSKSVPAVDHHQLLVPKEMMKHIRMLKVDLDQIEFPEIFRFQFKYLRVLTLGKRHRNEYSQSTESQLSHVLGKLIHLRYLSVRCSRVDILFPSLGKLIKLQTLYLNGSVNPSTPMNSLGNLRELKFISLPLPIEAMFDCGCHGPKCLHPLRLDALSKLEILDNYNSSICDVGELLKLTNLRVLTVWEEYLEENNLERIVDYIHHSESLQYVSIFIDCILASNKQPLLLQKLLSAKSLKELHIECLPYWFTKFEDNLSTSAAGIVNLNICFVSNEKEMSNPMVTLEKLPNLRRLSLKQVDIDVEEMVSRATSFPQLRTLTLYEFPHLRNWTVEKGAFPQLRTLNLLGLRDMRSWTVEEEAMPNLSSLYLHNVLHLNELPQGLKVLKTLKTLNYRDIPESLEKQIKAHLNELA